jgi:NAD-dependent dihydropyrimidine dehydrogenase PreA subunit
MIVQIDEEKCDGCGLCVPSCEEGAIQIIGGKARLVSEVYCDGLGACLGHCPQGAISIVEREAEPFDEHAAMQHVRAMQPAGDETPCAGTCPGSTARDLGLNVLSGGPSVAQPTDETAHSGDRPSGLANWPVQLHLVPPQAPFLQNADVLLVADCVPFAYADFHGRFLDGRPVVIGCPKLDDGQAYVEKLAQMLRVAGIRSLTVLHMEVPCCTGLLRIAEAAMSTAGVEIPLESVEISIRGKRLGSRDRAQAPVES